MLDGLLTEAKGKIPRQLKNDCECVVLKVLTSITNYIYFQDVTDLHKLMLELHSLVADQGETSDSIADHIQNAEEHVESANKHLKKTTIVKVLNDVRFFLRQSHLSIANVSTVTVILLHDIVS